MKTLCHLSVETFLDYAMEQPRLFCVISWVQKNCHQYSGCTVVECIPCALVFLLLKDDSSECQQSDATNPQKHWSTKIQMHILLQKNLMCLCFFEKSQHHKTTCWDFQVNCLVAVISFNGIL